MTDEKNVSPATEQPEPTEDDPAEAHGARLAGTAQSLTDFFDQMDRASFKRALANRDAFRDTVVPAKFQRR
ncbi:MAG: hypothetical protein PVF63_08730 [Gammaproteobacteria bacterium]|jgi:hypothetical protein